MTRTYDDVSDDLERNNNNRLVTVGEPAALPSLKRATAT